MARARGYRITHRGHQGCNVDGCESPHWSRGFCNKHYLKFWKWGDPLHGRFQAPDGTGYIRPDGYRVVTVNGVQVLEHRHVAETALGRPLPKGAVVHHVDEDPQNNEPTNLVICPSQAYHAELHARMRAIGWTPTPKDQAA